MAGVRWSEADIGKRYGRLTVLDIGPKGQGSGRKVKCRCDCGAIRNHHAAALRNGVTVSCGCYGRQRLMEVNSTLKGGAGTLTHSSWRSMVKRCHYKTEPQFAAYGAKGIVVCDQWRNSFITFLADMGERPSRAHSIDRIDNNKGYEPGNCRWATTDEQLLNRRNTRWLTAFGETRTFRDWCRLKGISEGCLRGRLVREKLPVEVALTRPLRRRL